MAGLVWVLFHGLCTIATSAYKQLSLGISIIFHLIIDFSAMYLLVITIAKENCIYLQLAGKETTEKTGNYQVRRKALGVNII